jgi:hypothetical protein
MQLGVVLNDIISKLSMCGIVLNLPLRLKKCFELVWISCWFGMATNIIIEETPSTLILDDHGVENHTCRHDVIEGFIVQ